jgi:hypothetical protein
MAGNGIKGVLAFLNLHQIMFSTLINYFIFMIRLCNFCVFVSQKFWGYFKFPNLCDVFIINLIMSYFENKCMKEN